MTRHEYVKALKMLNLSGVDKLIWIGLTRAKKAPKLICNQ